MPVEKMVAKLIGKRGPRLDIRLLAGRLLEEFGGYDGLAQYTKKCFDSNPEGGSNQVRILADVMRLIGQTQAAEGDDGDMDPEAIEALLRAKLAEMGEDVE